MFRGKLCRALSVFLSGTLCCGGVSFARRSDISAIDNRGTGFNLWNMTKGAVVVTGVAAGVAAAYIYRDQIYDQVRFFLDSPDAEELWEKFRIYDMGLEKKVKLLLALYKGVYDSNVGQREICELVELFVENEFWVHEIKDLVGRLNVSGNLNKAIKYIGEKVKNSRFGKILDGRVGEIGDLRNSVRGLRDSVRYLNVDGKVNQVGADEFAKNVDKVYEGLVGNVNKNDLRASVDDLLSSNK